MVVLFMGIFGFIYLRLSGEPEETPAVQKEQASVVKQQKPVKKPDIIKESEPLPAPPEPEKLTKQADPEPVKPEPEVQIVEKTVEVEKQVEVISVPNAVKIFMFDRRLDQDRINISGHSIDIVSDSNKSASSIKKDLKNYLRDNRLTISSGDPLKVKDTHWEYTLTFSVKTPPPVVKKPEPKKPEKQAVKQPAKQTTKTPEKPKPAPVAQKPAPKPIKFTAKMALVIDDCGYSIPLAQKLATLGYPATFAVIPYTPYAKETAKLAKSSGNKFFVHFPMQPKSYPSFDPGKGALFLNMPEALIASVTRANMQSFGITPDGVNNHTGSAFTENEEKMVQALTSIREYTNRYLDSYTSPASKAYKACRELGMQCAVNSTFLDNEEPGLVTGSDKQHHVHAQLVAAARRALSSGSTIVIGHLRGDTIAALPDALSEIEKMGVKIVPVTDLMN